MRLAVALHNAVVLVPVLLLSVLLFAGGCATSFNPTLAATANSTSLGGLRGMVHGGQQPIVGSHVYLFAAGTAAYGGSSVSLLNDNDAFTNPLPPNIGYDGTNYYILSDSTGSFTLTGGYTCTPGQQVYLYASGGDPGAGANAAIGLMAVLGQCPSAGTFAAAVPFAVIDEVSTIAAAYAMAGFATDPTHVTSAASASSPISISNAFANAANLANLATGAALSNTPAGNGAVPQAEIDTLADILAACVNAAAGGGGCPTLFSAATSDGTATGIAPTNTATAALNIAHNPGASAILALVSLQTPTSPFQPTLSSTAPPNDFTIALTFGGAGLTGTSAGTLYGLAIDGSGSVWVADGSSVAELLSTGAPAPGSPFSGTYDATAVAIDASGYIVVADGFYPPSNGPSVTFFTDTGTLYGSTGVVPNFPGTSAVGAQTIAALPRGGISATGELYLLNYTGPVSSTYFGEYEIDAGMNPYSVATGFSDTVWVTNATGVALTYIGPHPTVINFTGGGLDGPRGIATGGLGAWVANFTGNSLSELSLGSGNSTNVATFTGGGLDGPQMLAIDGAGNVWIANLTSSSLSEFSSAGTPLSPMTGYLGRLSSPYSVAVDGSGNVWLSNSGTNTLTEFVGLAAPIYTPLGG
jgi:streptogramin lyase